MNQLLDIMTNKRIANSSAYASASTSANCCNDQYKHVASIIYSGTRWREVSYRIQ